MARTKRASKSDSKPATSADQAKPRRGRPPKKERATERATRVLPNGNIVHAAPAAIEMIAVPRIGHGRTRKVPLNSLDGIAAQLATQLSQEVARELAPRIVGRVREIAETMIRTKMDELLAGVK